MRRILPLVWLSILCGPSIFAQAGQHPRIARTKEKSAIHVPPKESSAALTVIYTNLKSKTDLYNDTEGDVVSGPNTIDGTEFLGMPFTPKLNSHVSEVQVAVQYSAGANQVNLSIYSDAGGAPGLLLAGPVTVKGLPTFGTCCAVAVANFSPVAVIAGTKYWVTAETPLTGTGSDFVGVWDWVATPIFLQARDKGAGWVPFDGSPAESAGKVLGTVP